MSALPLPMRISPPTECPSPQSWAAQPIMMQILDIVQGQVAVNGQTLRALVEFAVCRGGAAGQDPIIINSFGRRSPGNRPPAPGRQWK